MFIGYATKNFLKNFDLIFLADDSDNETEFLKNFKKCKTYMYDIFLKETISFKAAEILNTIKQQYPKGKKIKEKKEFGVRFDKKKKKIFFYYNGKETVLFKKVEEEDLYPFVTVWKGVGLKQVFIEKEFTSSR